MKKKRLFMPVALIIPCILCGCAGQSAGNTVQSDSSAVQSDSSTVQSTDNAMPKKHVIAYDEDLSTLDDDLGADSFESCLDSADSKYYVTNDYYNMKSDDTLHIISNFETYQQTTEYTCGPAALEMVLYHYGIDDYNELELAKMTGTKEPEGCTVEGMCKALDELGMKYEYHADTDYKFETNEDAEAYFMDCIDQNHLIMVDWEDWGGHWQVVIGIDTCGTDVVYDDVLILADPYDVTDQYQDGYYTYPFGRFMSMWREGQCADKEVPYEQPYVTVLE